MANKWAIQNGNWSDGSTWNDGVVPTADDDVYANGYTIQNLPQIVNVKSLRNTPDTNINSGGSFYNYNGSTVVLNCDMYCYSTWLYQGSRNDYDYTTIINGNIYIYYSSIVITYNANAHSRIYNINGNILQMSPSSGGTIITNHNRGIQIYINGFVDTPDYYLTTGDDSNTDYNNITIQSNCKIRGVQSTYIKSTIPLNVLGVLNITDYDISDVFCNSIEYENGFNLIPSKIHPTDVQTFSIRYVGQQPDTNPYVIINPNDIVSTYPTEQQVTQGVTYGMQNEYEGRLALPPESTVLKDVEYGDNQKGTLEVIALSGATATAESISVVNLTEQEVERVKNCATVSTVQKCFEDFKEE